MSSAEIPGTSDPYLWLEEIEGEEALNWVREQNTATLNVLEADPRFASLRDKIETVLTAKDRIPFGGFDGTHVYNFWQDDTHIRGLLRRTSIESYRSENPAWETVLDIDALAKAESENWIYKEWAVLNPDRDRALVTLSRGGQDASVVREFDLEKLAFVKDGFNIEEAKTSVSWIERDHIIVGTDYGEGSLTGSGYARILKIWRRGKALADATLFFEGKQSDVGVYPMVSTRDGRSDVFALQRIGFFDLFLWRATPGGVLKQLPLPSTTQPSAFFHGKLLISLKEDWSLGQTTWPQGAIVSIDLDAFDQSGELAVSPFLIPEHGVTVEGIAATKDYIYAALLEDVTNRLIRIKPADDGDWTRTPIVLPSGGTLSITSVSSKHNLVMVACESFLTPQSLYIIDDANEPEGPIKSLPARFDASALTMEQRFTISEDVRGFRIFWSRPKTVRVMETRRPCNMVMGFLKSP